MNAPLIIFNPLFAFDTSFVPILDPIDSNKKDAKVSNEYCTDNLPVFEFLLIVPHCLPWIFFLPFQKIENQRATEKTATQGQAIVSKVDHVSISEGQSEW